MKKLKKPIKSSSYACNQEKKNLVYKVLHRSILLGVTKKPSSCSRCGVSDQTIVGHHWNYDHPLDVEWVCGKCHFNIHESEKDKIIGGVLSCEDIKKGYDHILSRDLPGRVRKPRTINGGDDSEVIDVVKLCRLWEISDEYRKEDYIDEGNNP